MILPNMMTMTAVASGQVPFPVLLYHSIAQHPMPGFERWTTDPAEFQQHIDLIRASGRSPLTVTALAAALRSGELPERPVAITFDDGFADNLAAVERLNRAGLPATVYVTSDYIGKSGMFDADGLRALAAVPGVEIGAHSVSHPRLDELGRSDVIREIRVSRSRIEELLGTEVVSFAYPHGAHDQRVMAEVTAAGFSSAAAVRDALSHDQDNPLRIARLTIEATTTQAQVEQALNGRGFPVAPLRERPQTMAYRYFRRGRRMLRQR
jgi:peptidoglycan/xylan/chitin deacetylase (PgdA/CDA1 family)